MRIAITGSSGLIGSALVASLEARRAHGGAGRALRCAARHRALGHRRRHHRRRRPRGPRRRGAPRGRGDRREALDRRAEAQDPREPHQGHRPPRRRADLAHGQAAGAGLRVGDRLLRRTVATSSSPRRASAARGSSPTSSPRGRPPPSPRPRRASGCRGSAPASCSHRRGGVLQRLAGLARFGLLGKLGSGHQWMSWISLADEVGAIRFLLEHDIASPVNLTAPSPVTNEVFTKTLGPRPAPADVPARPELRPEAARRRRAGPGAALRRAARAPRRPDRRRLRVPAHRPGDHAPRASRAVAGFRCQRRPRTF